MLASLNWTRKRTYRLSRSGNITKQSGGHDETLMGDELAWEIGTLGIWWQQTKSAERAQNGNVVFCVCVRRAEDGVMGNVRPAPERSARRPATSTLSSQVDEVHGHTTTHKERALPATGNSRRHQIRRRHVTRFLLATRAPSDSHSQKGSARASNAKSIRLNFLFRRFRKRQICRRKEMSVSSFLSLFRWIMNTLFDLRQLIDVRPRNDIDVPGCCIIDAAIQQVVRKVQGLSILHRPVLNNEMGDEINEFNSWSCWQLELVGFWLKMEADAESWTTRSLSLLLFPICHSEK